jgi:predicted transcriptional regulator
MSWAEYGFVVASVYRMRVLLSLYNHPKTPSQVSNETNLALAHVSRALKQLSQKNLVVCLTPNMVKGKVYSLTEKGKLVVSIIKENQKINE